MVFSNNIVYQWSVKIIMSAIQILEHWLFNSFLFVFIATVSSYNLYIKELKLGLNTGLSNLVSILILGIFTLVSLQIWIRAYGIYHSMSFYSMQFSEPATFNVINKYYDIKTLSFLNSRNHPVLFAALYLMLIMTHNLTPNLTTVLPSSYFRTLRL